MRNEQVPDRRPLVYVVVGALILIAAGYLFWPGRGDDDSTPMVLTPASVESAMNAAREDPSLESEAAQAATGPNPTVKQDLSQPSTATPDRPSTAGTDQRSEDLGTSNQPRAETTIVDARPERSSSQPTRLPAPPEPLRTEIRPGDSGRYVLNLGSFSERGNADRLVERLSRDGVSAEVKMATTDKAGTVYRVRVGYFDVRSEAERYGKLLKSRYQLSSWVGPR